MRKILNYLLLAVCIGVNLFISHWVGQLAYSWMPAQGTAEAKQVDDIFSFLTSIGTFIFLGITGVIVYSIITCRAPKGDWSHGHPARGSTRLEILWTVIPTIIVLWLSVKSLTIYQQLNIQGLPPVVMHMHMEEPAVAAEVSKDTKTVGEVIDVFAKQWAWSFRYPNNVTSNELHLIVNQPVSLALHAQDVLHGFFVPEFRLKQDMVPGRIITLILTPQRVGKYRLHDSQFSGTYFALMEADVYVESRQAYDQWLTVAASREPTLASNKASAEHNQPSKKLFNSRWDTVKPAEPSIVNYSA
ncbi:cytochrome c oxidase subunit II [Aetokthonos hydrillicola Thurmond2011]|jgi:cytochrome c oxidase subunit 2|uniref:Cytochrome c oxidase subunit 2 n=1 Tax=Aetokthonos hydrillicola Thurmond2011 TaxID=2712845 RepID=A0AAP5I2J0_9CYAN|nr:cytochrome c oxidase subunit II [Aetokthonos hydrillicola]MBO3458279.1 cytochrome c oxidase subunit II [Aetokthonos hydrillicola CCALA 1050]MBW4585841.1 cytochrome c oxidase subunit II [Aetokthonos hydrillicola CCALA 1050]MDR9893933.1 cytochrome c oxidase subunit II [Aetokthonos hydrillicola Thurmond2011]